jgi:HEAT repeat protein
MSFRRLLDRLLITAKVPEKSVSDQQQLYYEGPGAYHAGLSEAFDKAYASWLCTKVLPQEFVQMLGVQELATHLGSRNGYVREFCLRSLALVDDAEAFKPVLQRLNDYVSGNRHLALRLTLKWLAELPLASLVDALPELEILKIQSRVDYSAVYEALDKRLATPEGREAFMSGLMDDRATVRRMCWWRCVNMLTWTATERIQFAMLSGDPAIARSVEPDAFSLPDEDLLSWFRKLQQVRAMPLRRAFLMALRRKNLLDVQTLIAWALWDNSFSIRWLARHWIKSEPELLLHHYVTVMQEEGGTRRKRYALEGLAELKSSEAVLACKAALNNPSPVVRKAALDAVCTVDAENQFVYVAAAMQDADMTVVREAFRQIVALGLPLPTEAIASAAQARRDDLAFFELLLASASRMFIWPALQLASFVSLATPELHLTSSIHHFLSRLQVTEVYLAPTPHQWLAVRAWAPMATLLPNAGLRDVMDMYAKRMGS